MSRERKVMLKSSDSKEFEVDEPVAYESQTLKDMIEATWVENPLLFPSVSNKILAKVIEYCKYHVEAGKSYEGKPAATKDEIKDWDRKFVKVDQGMLLHLVYAASYLDIQKLLDLTTQAVANMIENMTVEEIRKIIQNQE